MTKRSDPRGRRVAILVAALISATAISTIAGCPEGQQLLDEALRILPELAIADSEPNADADTDADTAANSDANPPADDPGVAPSPDEPPDVADPTGDGDPSAACPDDLTVECDGDGNQVEFQEWLAGVIVAVACEGLEINYNIEELSDTCGGTSSALVEWKISDECGPRFCSARFTIADTTEPNIEGPEDLTVECDGQGNLDELNKWLESATADDLCGEVDLTHDFDGFPEPPGGQRSARVTWTATDACGNQSMFAATFTIEDTQPPQVIVGDMRTLWPPNHRYVTYKLSDCVDSVIDTCDGELDIDAAGSILSIYSDEPENATGDGNTTDDVVISGNSTFMLRAERRGDGNGRVYGITFEVVDSAGNKTQAICFVGVPHDQSGEGPIDDGRAAGYNVEK